MRTSGGWLVAGAALLAMMVAPVAKASGVNSGGASGGGGGSPVATPSGVCAPIASLTNTVGYYRSWAAIWTTFTLPACEVGTAGTWDMTFHNDDTGQIDYERRASYVVPSSGYSAVVDDDFAPFSTNYTVTLTLTDSNGVRTSRSASTTTKPAKSGP
jgi:hypothetical protein